MSKPVLYFAIILLIPTFAETINGKDFIVPVPGLPFSLGRLTFLLTGVLGVTYNRNFYFKSNLFKGMLLIFAGSLVGAVFSDNFLDSVSRSFGNIVLLIGAIGLASLCSKQIIQGAFDFFFIANLLYWTYYVFNLMVFGGFNIVSYNKLFTSEDAINHHVIGINCSVSCIYIALRFFYKEGRFSLPGFAVVFLGLLNCLLTETRSNLVITIAVFFVILLLGKIKFSRILVVSVPLLILMFVVLSNIASLNDSILQRFDATDEDYQERTTAMRFNYIYEALLTISRNPFGQGVFGAEIESSGFGSTMVHNQYLTFILAGGVFAFFGIILWLWEYIKIFKYTIKHPDETAGFGYAVVFSMLAFLFTLFTIEFTGMIFFLYISLLLYLSESFFTEKIITLKMRFLK